MVTVEEAERKLRRRGAMRSHLVAVFLTACVSLSAMEAGADAPRPDPPEAPPIAAATPPQAAAAAVEHAAPAGSPADAAANAPAETMEAECMPTSDRRAKSKGAAVEGRRRSVRATPQARSGWAGEHHL